MRVPRAAGGLLAAISLTGCTSAYWTDRGRDLLDVPTMAIQANEYVVLFVQAGPFGTGLNALFQWPREGRAHGLLGGRLDSATYRDFALLMFETRLDLSADTRRKAYSYEGFFPWPVLYPSALGPAMTGNPNDRYRMAPRYTQFQISASALLGARLGVNPGEFADFLAGFFGGDLYGDDVAAKEGAEEKGEPGLPPPKEDLPPRAGAPDAEPKRGERLVLLGTVVGIRTADSEDPRLNFLVRVKVDRVVEGSYRGERFEFSTHSPARSGLEEGKPCRIEAVWTGSG